MLIMMMMIKSKANKRSELHQNHRLASFDKITSEIKWNSSNQIEPELEPEPEPKPKSKLILDVESVT